MNGTNNLKHDLFLLSLTASVVFLLTICSCCIYQELSLEKSDETSLYLAKGDPVMYQLTVDFANGQTPYKHYYEEGASLAGVNELNNEPVREGYTFTGWNNRPSTMPAENLVIKATWTPNDIQITFDTDNGAPAQVIVQKTNTTLTAPEGFQKTGYDFIGWDPEVPSRVPTHNTTYTALWEAKTYRVDFYDGNMLIEYGYFVYDSDIIFPIVSKEGYHPNWGTITKVPAEDTALHLEWEINQHNVTFTLAEGTSVSSMDYNSRVTVPDPGKKVGYYFDGWYPEVPEYMPDTDLTFESVWHPTQKAGTGQDSNRFIASGGDSVTVCKSDLSGIGNAVIGVEGKWYVTIDGTKFSGDDNLRITVAEVPKDTVGNLPKGTSVLYLMEVEDGGKRVIDMPCPMSVSVSADIPSGKIPSVHIISGSDPVKVQDVQHSDGMLTFSASDLAYFAAGYTNPDDPVPIATIAAVIAAVSALGAVLAVMLFRSSRKV